MKPFASYFRSFVFSVVVVICWGTPLLKAQNVVYRRITSSVSDDTLSLSHREEMRVERFLKRVYPSSGMQRAIHAHSAPLLKKATYDVIKLKGIRYALVAYVSEWKQPEGFVHELAIYRLGADGPNQVWRSAAWVANYYGLTFETAVAGSRMLVLFREGGLDPSGFSLSGVLSFRESK
jgi:hypothetical protein